MSEMGGSAVALLAPVPEKHLIDGLQSCATFGDVSFGSRDFEVFRELDGLLGGRSCQVLIYSSWADKPIPGPATVIWIATYREHVEARPDGSAPVGVNRPASTVDDQKGHWAVYWRISDLVQLPRTEWIKVSLLRGHQSGRNYLKSFRPERPLIVEAL